MDHGYAVDENRRCTAKTQKLKQCSMPALRGIELCALHAGLAKPRTDAAYGDPKALETYRRSLAARASRPPVRERAR